MRIFLRIMAGFWLALLIVIAAVAFIPRISATFEDERSRSIPLEILDVCAKQAVELYRQGGANALEVQDAGCYGGTLVSVTGSPDLDLARRPLSREQRSVARRTAEGANLVVQEMLTETTIGLRVGPRSPAYAYVVTIPTQRRASVMWHTNNFWLLILSSGLFSYFLTSYVVRPVTSLSRVAAQFGAGDLKARAASPLLRRKDEFGELGKVFNHMASKIEVLISRYKSFLAHASHELGSPLTRLNIALALAKRKAGPQLQPELDRIGQEADRINNLVHELLLLARLESDNELSRTPVSFDVGALVEEIRAEAMLEAKQIRKTVLLDRQESFAVRGYPELLRRAIENVLRNALRFAREQGTVHISYFQKSNLAVGVILIEDDGPGVPLGKEQAIFEPFLTLPSENLENGSGSGLGLAIAKQAVLVNGGTIFAYSLTDRGLAVSIELPIEVMK